MMLFEQRDQRRRSAISGAASRSAPNRQAEHRDADRRADDQPFALDPVGEQRRRAAAPNGAARAMMKV